MPQEQHHYHQQQMYGQMPLQQQQHQQQHQSQQQQPIHSDKQQGHWQSNAANAGLSQAATTTGEVSETRTDDTEDEDESSSNKKSSTKTSLKKKKKLKSKSSLKPTKKASGNANSKVKSKSKKKTNEVLDESKYEDKNVLEVAVRLKKGCDCSENCMKGKELSKISLHRVENTDLWLFFRSGSPCCP